MSTLAQLAQVPNLGSNTVIERLVEAARESAGGAQKTLPLATFFLKSGLSLRGQALAFSDDTGPRSVVILMHASQEQPQDLAYVLISEIAGVAIHGAMNIIENLSDGRITKPLATAPTFAELHKMGKSAVDELNALTEAKMALEMQDPGAQASPDLLQALYLSLRDLYAILKKMAGEELSRRSLQEQNFQFAIKFTDSPTVQIKRSAVLITIGYTQAGIDRVSRESLRAYLEEVL